jgi:short-subunit dehydrogenase
VRHLITRAALVDVLVANAGIGIPQNLGMLSDDEIEEAIRIHSCLGAPWPAWKAQSR